MRSATAEIEIARPMAEVHAVLENLVAHESFLDHFLHDWKRITRQSSGVGTAVRVRTGRRRQKLIMRLIKSSRRRVVVESKGGKAYRRRVRSTYDLKERRNGATRVRCTLEFLEGSVADRLAWPGVRWRLRRGTRAGLQRLKEKLEA